MRRTALIYWLLVVLAVLSAGPAVAIASGGSTDSGSPHLSEGTVGAPTVSTAPAAGTARARPARNETSPGSALSRGLTAEGASLDGAVQRADFRTALGNAETERERAAVVAEYLDSSQDDLSQLESDLVALNAARANGSLSQTQYERQTSRIRADASRLSGLSVALANASANLSAESLSAAGINKSDIERLGTDADRIAGDGVGTTGRERVFFGQVTELSERYNEDDPDLGVAGGAMRGNLVNLYVARANDSDVVLSFRVTDDNEIEDVRAGARKDAPIRMETDNETVGRIVDADSPSKEFREAVESGDIEIEGVGLWSEITWAILNFLLNVANAFS